MTTLPTEQRPIRMDPELSERVEKILDRYSGSDLEKAQAAVMKVYHSGFAGSFGQLVERYDEAVREAVEGE